MLDLLWLPFRVYALRAADPESPRLLLATDGSGWAELDGGRTQVAWSSIPAGIDKLRAIGASTQATPGHAAEDLFLLFQELVARTRLEANQHIYLELRDSGAGAAVVRMHEGPRPTRTELLSWDCLAAGIQVIAADQDGFYQDAAAGISG